MISQQPGWARRVLDAAADGIWVVGLDGRTLDANAATADLLGRPLEEMAQVQLADVLDAAGHAQFLEHLVRLRQGQVNPGVVECLFHRSDGAPVWVLVREALVRDDRGEDVVGVVLTIADHHERRQLIAELNASEHRRLEAERIARLGSWRWSAERESFEVSEGIRRLYGSVVDEVFASTESYFAAVHPEDRDRVRDTISGAVAEGSPFEFEARVRAETGYIWIRGRGVGVRDDGGGLAEAYGTHQDVTRARDTDEALQDLVTQTSLLRTVATAANEAVTLDEVLVHARDMVLLHDDWDRAHAFVPTADGSALVLHHLDDDGGTDPDDQSRDAVLLRRERAVAHRAFESRVPVWDDETRLTLAFPVVLDDTVLAVLTITSLPPLFRHEMIQEMTEQVAGQLARVAERERAARALADARDRAMEASRHKSDFLATMSHEIRTPLNGIVGLSDLLGRTVLDDQQRHLVSGVELSSRALLDIINDILDFSKIEAGRLELEAVDFEIREVLDHAVGVLADAARVKNLELHVSCSPDVPQWVTGDPTRLGQVVTNLCSNAVKFTAAGQVDLRATVVGTEASGSVRVRVEVRDTGIGVPRERADSIFQPFAQADATTTRRFGGTGLGLAISQEIVEAVGGTLGVDSVEGQGSTFWFEVPLGTPTGATLGESMTRTREQLQGMRVLVVDDVPTNRHILAEQLAWWGVESVAVAGAEQALHELTSTEFDLAILDMAMPDVDGLTLAARIHAQAPTAPLRMVMFTSSLPLDAATRTAHGIAECLTKPVSSTALRDVLARTVARASQDAPGRAASAVPRRHHRVLVVEDNAINQLVATGYLDALGYDSDTAVDGVEALELLREQTYDLVLMDVQMPRLDGYGATAELRRREREEGRSRIPVVAMTASAVEGERRRALEVGMDDFITKPVRGSRLAETIARWLEGSAAAGEPTPAHPVASSGHASTDAAGPEDAAAAAVSVIDPERVADLLDISPDGRYLRRAIGGFLDGSGGMLGAVVSAVAAGDRASQAFAAHSLRGSAGNLGLAHLASLAHVVELAGSAGGPPPEGAVDELGVALTEAVGALTELEATLPRTRSTAASEQEQGG